MQNPPVASHDRKKGRVIPDADWELHRQTIELLVCKERWILKDVMDHMAKNCGFIASQQQYTRKLEAWGAVKNLSTAEWNAVSYKVQKRKRESDKDSEVMVNGKRFDTKKLKTKANYARNRSDRLKSSQDTREHSYYYYKDQEASSMNTRSPQSADAISPKTPQNVSVYTPGNKIQIDLEKIPWFQFEKKLDDLLAKNLSPTNMQQLVSMLSRNENAQGGVERNTSTAGSGQILLYNSTLDHSAIPDAYTCLEALHLQRRKGEFWKALQTASESEDHNLVFRLKHALQLSSNKALSQHDMNSLLKTFKDAGEIDMIKAVCSLDDLGARSFAESVLDSSVRLGYYELTIYLLLVSRAVSPDLPCPRYGSLFCTAIRLGEGWNSEGEDDPHGHRRLLEGFLDAGVDIERGKPYTPLIMALLQCDNAVSVVSLLLDRKADVNRRTSPSERTPLQAILFEYNEDDAGGWEYRLDALELVKLLLDAGADVNALPAHGYRAHSCRPVYSYTALQLAATFLPLVELSSQSELGLEDEAGPRSTFADKENYEQIIDTLLSYSAHVNAPPGSFCGRTALQGAAEAASTSVVTKLLEYGADLNAPAALHGGFTALQAAAFHGNEEVVEILLRRGADVNAPAAELQGRTALGAAVEGLSTFTVALLLDEKADPNAIGSTDWNRTPLQTILSRFERRTDYPDADGSDTGSDDAGSDWSDMDNEFDQNLDIKIEIVRLLLNGGADPHLRHSESSYPSPMEMAFIIDNERLTRVMGGTSAQAVQISSEYCDTVVRRLATVLSRSERKSGAFTSSLKTLRTIVTAGARVKDDDPTADASILQVAYRNPQITSGSEVFSLLVKLGCKINAPASSETLGTILQVAVNRACYRGHSEVVALLGQGADVNAPPSFSGGMTALQIVAAGGWGTRQLPYGSKSSKGDIILAKLLLEHKADYDAPTANRNGITALQGASSRGDTEMVKLLLDKGANVNADAPPPSGKTALQEACAAGSFETAHLLLLVDKDVESRRNALPSPYGGRTALQAAAEVGNMDLLKLLIEKGKANVNMAPAPVRGVTALQAAAIQGLIGMVSYLLDRGADPNAPAAATEGRTALDGAAERGRLDVVKMLLECKAGMKKKTDFVPRTPADDDSKEEWIYDCSNAIRLARDEGHNVVVKVLQEYHDPSLVFDIPQDMLPMDDFNDIPMAFGDF